MSDPFENCSILEIDEYAISRKQRFATQVITKAWGVKNYKIVNSRVRQADKELKKVFA